MRQSIRYNESVVGKVIRYSVNNDSILNNRDGHGMVSAAESKLNLLDFPLKYTSHKYAYRI